MTWLSSLQLSFDNPAALKRYKQSSDDTSAPSDLNEFDTAEFNHINDSKSAYNSRNVSHGLSRTSMSQTRLYHRLHTGALMIQRPLYPEPDAQQGICHIYVLYPPAGIADGDFLTLTFILNPFSHAVITTPGAGKWYGHRQAAVNHTNKTSEQSTVKPVNTSASLVIAPSDRPPQAASAVDDVKNGAKQTITATVDAEAILEWLPQESIYYDHSFSNAVNHFDLAATASLLAWDISVFGRKAYDETFKTGHFTSQLHIRRGDKVVVSEHTNQPASARWFTSALGLNNQHVHGSFWAVPSVTIAEVATSGSTLDPSIKRKDSTDNATKPKTLQAQQYALTQALDATVDMIRALIDEQDLPIVCTHNYQAINCRYLGGNVRACFEAFYSVRELLRQRWYGLIVHRPRIWDT